MSRKAVVRGKPPSTLTGQLPISSEESPWWSEVISNLSSYGIKVGEIYTIEEITAMVPSYPDGRRPRSKATSRRLKPVLELVERGPNGALGRGAKYRVVEVIHPPKFENGDEPIQSNEDWLNDAVSRMTRNK